MAGMERVYHSTSERNSFSTAPTARARSFGGVVLATTFSGHELVEPPSPPT